MYSRHRSSFEKTRFQIFKPLHADGVDVKERTLTHAKTLVKKLTECNFSLHRIGSVITCSNEIGKYGPWSVPSQRDWAHCGSAQRRWIWGCGSVRWNCTVTSLDHCHVTHTALVNKLLDMSSPSTALDVSSISHTANKAPLHRLAEKAVGVVVVSSSGSHSWSWSV